jgi:uncharacterized protein YjcR
MRQDKELVFKLRKEGLSYREIENKLNISRSTLCDWFKKEEWSKHIKKSNMNRNIVFSTDRLKLLNDGRNKMLKNKYEKVELDAEKEFHLFKKDCNQTICSRIIVV